MDRNANIYRAPEDEIPAEDTARLDGYLTAKAEEGEHERLKAEYEKAVAEMADSEASS